MPDRSEVRRVSMTAHDRLSVDAVVYDDGSLVIEGQDLGPDTPGGDDLEYFFTIEPADVPLLVAALGGADGADPLELLEEQGAAIVMAGEMHWLDQHQVPYRLRSW